LEICTSITGFAIADSASASATDVCVTRRVDDDAVRVVTRGVQPVDQLMFGVGLTELEFQPEPVGRCGTAARRRPGFPRHMGLAGAQQIQVRAVQHQHLVLAHVGFAQERAGR
jgi:hypothetical protein